MHGASLTPQKSGDEKKLKNMDKQGEKKAKHVKGVFFTDKTGLNFYSEKLFNKYFTSLFLMLHGGQISDL